MIIRDSIVDHLDKMYWSSQRNMVSEKVGAVLATFWDF